jgi:mono/diheme cytochrome c family protein
MIKRLTSALFLSLGVILIAHSFTTTEAVAIGQTNKKSAAEGRKLFMQYCASCHGTDAKGTGPAAKALKKAPADLTKIPKENGKFPGIRIQRAIAGDDMLESHGSREMPIWGTYLRQKVGPGFAKMDIYNLTSYLESIQQ